MRWGFCLLEHVMVKWHEILNKKLISLTDWWTTHSLLTRTEKVCVSRRPSDWSAWSDQTDWSPPPVWVQYFLFPGAPLSEQSDSPSASELHETCGRQHCSSLFSHSKSCPGQFIYYKYHLVTVRWTLTEYERDTTRSAKKKVLTKMFLMMPEAFKNKMYFVNLVGLFCE